MAAQARRRIDVRPSDRNGAHVGQRHGPRRTWSGLIVIVATLLVVVSAGYPAVGAGSDETRGAHIWGPAAFLDGMLLFGARDGVHGTALWRSDGTRRGTQLLHEIRPLSRGS